MNTCTGCGQPTKSKRFCSPPCYWKHGIKKTYDRTPSIVTGTRFGRLVVQGCLGQREERGYFYYECLCDCGTQVERHHGNLKRSGDHQSCGCYQRENKPATRHGGCGTLTYRSWRSMLQRCLDPEHDNYPSYGGRGIKVCERWQGRDGFEHFRTDMGERPSKGMTIDRKDVNGNYEPENCRWATWSEQNRNKRKRVVST